jgi:hypothetical protein
MFRDFFSDGSYQQIIIVLCEVINNPDSFVCLFVFVPLFLSLSMV